MDDGQKKLREAYFEVITSEASYLRSLSFLSSHFMCSPEFVGSKNGRSIITNSERKHLFSNIVAIRDCSERLLLDFCSDQVYQDQTLNSLKASNPLFSVEQIAEEGQSKTMEELKRALREYAEKHGENVKKAVEEVLTAKGMADLALETYLGNHGENPSPKAREAKVVELERALDELSKKASADAAQFADELRREKEHSQRVDRLRKELEVRVEEMQLRLDETEAMTFMMVQRDHSLPRIQLLLKTFSLSFDLTMNQRPTEAAADTGIHEECSWHCRISTDLRKERDTFSLVIIGGEEFVMELDVLYPHHHDSKILAGLNFMLTYGVTIELKEDRQRFKIGNYELTVWTQRRRYQCAAFLCRQQQQLDPSSQLIIFTAAKC